MRVLVADVPEMKGRLAEILDGHEPFFVHTFREAVEALKGGSWDVLVVGLHFDESQPFALLEHVQHSGATELCVVLIRGLDRYSPVTGQGFQLAGQSFGCRAFIDFAQFARSQAGNEQIRTLIESAAAAR